MLAPMLSADRVDDQVGAASVRELTDPLRDVLAGVVDAVIHPVVAEPLESVVADAVAITVRRRPP